MIIITHLPFQSQPFSKDRCIFMSKIAAAYIRVSTDRQDEYSPDSQKKLIREYAEKHDFEIPDEYIFYDDGISAKSAKKRTAFNQMIAIAKEKHPPFCAILVWKFSRFARNQEESIVYKNILRKKGIQVISISEPIIDSPFGDLIERIIEWMDEYYLINLSTEVRRGMTEKHARGEALVPPAFGYDIVEHKYIPNETEAATVQGIFRDFLANVPTRKIALNLAAQGVLNHRGNLIDQRGIMYILENPVYVGKIRWSPEGRASSDRYKENKGVIVDGVHQPIITAEVWEAAQAKLAEQKKMYGKYQRAEQPVEWMLKGLLRCGTCGATLCLGSKKDMYAQCHNYTTARGKCFVSHHISIPKANKLVIQLLEEIAVDKNFTFVASPSVVESINYEELIHKEKIKLNRAKDAYLNGIDTVEEYKANKQRIIKAIETLEKQRDEERIESADLDEYADKVRSVIETVKNPDASELAKNQALRTIIEKIVYNKPDNSLDVFFHW